MEHGIIFYESFSVKSIEQVTEILERHGHENILERIELTGTAYTVRNDAWSPDMLPTYRLALACSVASLGNAEQAHSIYANPELALSGIEGDKISQDLANDLKN